VNNVQQKPANRSARIRRFLAQSDYITAIWNWFMILAGKAAEPVLVASVLYASVKLLPVVHLPSQYDVVVFIAQFIALDIGGLSLNKLADQAKKDGNDEGAKQAKDLSIALVAVMLVGVIMAGVDQVVKLDGTVATVIDTMLLIARAVLAVLYGRVIHGLRKDEAEPQTPDADHLEELVTETVNTVLTEALATIRQETASQFEHSLSQRLDEHLTALNTKQAEAVETVMARVETALQHHRDVSQLVRGTKSGPSHVPASQKVRSLSEAAALRKRVDGGTGKQEIDGTIWPLLDAGLSVRTIATRADTSTATVGRSRKRWVAAGNGVPVSHLETHNQPPMFSDYETARETEERA